MNQTDATNRSDLTADRMSGASKQATFVLWFWPIVAALLFVQAGLAVDCARRWTPTHDEYWHLPIGLRMWSSDRWDDDVINPPPVRLWAAMPLAFAGVSAGTPVARPDKFDGRPDVGDIGDAFWSANPHARQYFFIGRLMIIPLALLTGLLIALWGRAWFGEQAAIVSLLLWTCCPTILANAAIVTHDLPLASAWMATLFALARFAERPSWRRALMFGGAWGLALLCKLTALVLAPLCVVLWFVLRRSLQDVSDSTPPTHNDQVPAVAAKSFDTSWLGSPSSTRRRIFEWVVALFFAVFVVDAGYLFHGVGSSLDGLPLASARLKEIQSALKPLGWIPVPLPKDYVAAVDRLAQDLERRHPVYLDGEWSDRPFVLYYAKSLIYKLPLSTLLLIAMACAAVVWTRPSSRDRHRAAFLIIAAIFLPVLASGSTNQIGIRYILPTLPLLHMLAGLAVRWLEDSNSVPDDTSVRKTTVNEKPSRSESTRSKIATNRRSRSGHRLFRSIVFLMLATLPLGLRHHPHHLAYFNLIAGGPESGRWHLVDSNIDWGQDLHSLKDYLDAQQINLNGLAYYGTVIPATVGLKVSAPPSRFPQPGWYAVSANFIQGRPHVLRDHNGDRTAVGIDEFGYFRYFAPRARIGYSIEVYQLTEQDVSRYAFELQKQQRGG